MADVGTENINLNPSNIIKLNKITHTIETPIIILKKRNFEVYVIEVEPGATYYSGAHGEKTTEYIIGIEGTLKLK